MPTIESYRELKVWQMGIHLAKECYELTKIFPKEETFGLTSQIRRSTTSIPANIAEGYGRETTGEYVQFLRIAQGSLKELETHLIVAGEIGICGMSRLDPLLELTDELGRMVQALIRTLQTHQKK